MVITMNVQHPGRVAACAVCSTPTLSLFPRGTRKERSGKAATGCDYRGHENRTLLSVPLSWFPERPRSAERHRQGIDVGFGAVSPSHLTLLAQTG